MGPGGVFGSVQLLSVALIFLAGPSLTRWLNRDVRFHNLGAQTEESAKSRGALSGVTSGFLLGFAFAFDGRRASARFSPPSWRSRRTRKRFPAAFSFSLFIQPASRFHFC